MHSHIVYIKIQWIIPCVQCVRCRHFILLGDARGIVSRQTLQVSAERCMQSKYHADSNPESQTIFFILVDHQGHIPANREGQLHLTGAQQPKQQAKLLNS